MVVENSNENQFSYFDPVPSKDIQTGQIFMKDAKCAETNEKSIFRYLQFLFFEL